MGTAGYMSPEQTQAKALDRRADVWAFGCILYELLAGRRAFPGGFVAPSGRRICNPFP
jgi:eukaryotic-like serine/threonine-protein kinase